MKFQLILSASALLLSTDPAAFAGATHYQQDAEYPQGQGGSSSSSVDGILMDGDGDVSLFSDMYGILMDGNYDGGSSSSSGDGTLLLEGEGGASLFNDAFVAIPNPFAGDSAAFRNGRQVGIRQAQNTWNRLGGTCRTAWRGYPNAINRIIRRLQRARQSDRNDGRIAGLNQELQRRRRECNGRNPNPPRPRPNPRNPQVCIRFGDEAARRIAWDFCNEPLLTGSRDSWRRDCRDVAINTCKGQVATEVQNQCRLPRNTRTLRKLQDQCTDKVDSMIGNSRRFTEEEMMLS